MLCKRSADTCCAKGLLTQEYQVCCSQSLSSHDSLGQGCMAWSTVAHLRSICCNSCQHLHDSDQGCIACITQTAHAATAANTHTVGTVFGTNGLPQPELLHQHTQHCRHDRHHKTKPVRQHGDFVIDCQGAANTAPDGAASFVGLVGL
jgi:hypothetical protein